MPVIYLVHGFTGAGKTTFSKKLEKENGAVRYSSDEWMRARHGENLPAEFFAQYLKKIKEDILEDACGSVQSGRNVIFDYGFWKRSERDEYRMLAKEWDSEYRLFWIKASDAVMEERVLARSRELPDGQLAIDKSAIDEFRLRFEPLQTDEMHTVIENEGG